MSPPRDAILYYLALKTKVSLQPDPCYKRRLHQNTVSRLFIPAIDHPPECLPRQHNVLCLYLNVQIYTKRVSLGIAGCKRKDNIHACYVIGVCIYIHRSSAPLGNLLVPLRSNYPTTIQQLYNNYPTIKDLYSLPDCDFRKKNIFIFF